MYYCVETIKLSGGGNPRAPPPPPAVWNPAKSACKKYTNTQMDQAV